MKLLKPLIEENCHMAVVITKENLSSGARIFVAHCPILGIASQGKDADGAMKNIKKAIGLYLEEQL